nr:uncharacterized protein LOC107126692 isoform X2 [Macaca fascicularis]
MFAVPSPAAGGRWQTAVCDREAWWVESRRAACEREEGQLRWRGLLGNVLPAPPFANAADGAPAQRVDFGLSAPLAVLQAASRRTMKEALRKRRYRHRHVCTQKEDHKNRDKTAIYKLSREGSEEALLPTP